MLSAMMRPPPFAARPPPIDGGGGTTARPGPASVDCVTGSNARCSARGNCGAGATTALWPIFISPHLRSEVASTVGGGPTIAGDGPCIVRAIEAAFSSGGGVTTDVDSAGRFISTLVPEVAASGTAGCAPFHATMLGKETS